MHACSSQICPRDLSCSFMLQTSSFSLASCTPCATKKPRRYLPTREAETPNPPTAAAAAVCPSSVPITGPESPDQPVSKPTHPPQPLTVGAPSTAPSRSGKNIWEHLGLAKQAHGTRPGHPGPPGGRRSGRRPCPGPSPRTFLPEAVPVLLLLLLGAHRHVRLPVRPRHPADPQLAARRRRAPRKRRRPMGKRGAARVTQSRPVGAGVKPVVSGREGAAAAGWQGAAPCSPFLRVFVSLPRGVLSPPKVSLSPGLDQPQHTPAQVCLGTK